MTDPTSPRERAEAFEALADARRSVRRFSDAPVPEEVMRSAFRSAHLAPSSNNLLPWEFHWVRPDSPRAPPRAASPSPPLRPAELVFLIGRPDLLADRAAAMVAHFEAEGNDGTASITATRSPATSSTWPRPQRVGRQERGPRRRSVHARHQGGWLRQLPMEGLDPDPVRASSALPKPPLPWPSRWARHPGSSTVTPPLRSPTTSASTEPNQLQRGCMREEDIRDGDDAFRVGVGRVEVGEGGRLCQEV